MAAFQPKPTGMPGLAATAGGQFYQVVTFTQPNGVKMGPQQVILAPVQPQLIQPKQNSNIQPKPLIQMSDGQTIYFQTVPNKAAAVSAAPPAPPCPQPAPQAPTPTVAQVQPVQHQLNTTSNNIQFLQQRLAEEEQKQDLLIKQLNEKKKMQKKSPEKKCEMEVDEPETNRTESEQNLTNCSIGNKKRGRPRLYEVDASTGKSIKGKLLNNVKQKPKMVLQPQIQISNGFAIYPSPSTSSSSSYSQPNFIINQPGQIVNPQFIPLNVVQPMVQEEKVDETEEEDEEMEEEENSVDKVEENSEKENIEHPVAPKAPTPAPPPPPPPPPPPEPIVEPEVPKKIVDTLKNLKSQVVLTHVIDGFVIKESSKPFPVKPVEPEMATESSPKKDDLSGLNSSCPNDQSMLNTSSSSQKTKMRTNSKSSPRKVRKTSKLDESESEKVQNYSFQNTSPQFNSTVNQAPVSHAPPPPQPQPPQPPQAVKAEEWPQGDPTEWNCDEVYRFVCLVAGQQVAEMFKSQEVDGSALSLIRDDHLVNTMGVKLGPALKIMSKFNELKMKFSQS